MMHIRVVKTQVQFTYSRNLFLVDPTTVPVDILKYTAAAAAPA